MKNKQKSRRGSLQQTKLYCMDCGVLLDHELTAETMRVRQEIDMPNMLIFCDECRSKLKNVLRRILNGIHYLFWQ